MTSDVANRLDVTFARLRQQGELGLFPFLTAGFPDPEICGELLRAMADAGADGLELGIAFSDPLADGVTLQRASARALAHGVSVKGALSIVRELRRTHQLPVVTMSYANPLLAYGYERFCGDAAEAGLDGVIVPDVPLEESDPFQAAAAAAGLHHIYMVAPTSGDSRVRAVGDRASGFIYCVALVGTTGARGSLASDLPAVLRFVRERVRAPIVAGFGLSTPGHVAELVGKADGAIVASAIADLIEQTPVDRVVEKVASFVAELKAVTRPAGVT